MAVDAIEDGDVLKVDEVTRTKGWLAQVEARKCDCACVSKSNHQLNSLGKAAWLPSHFALHFTLAALDTLLALAHPLDSALNCPFGPMQRPGALGTAFHPPTRLHSAPNRPAHRPSNPAAGACVCVEPPTNTFLFRKTLFYRRPTHRAEKWRIGQISDASPRLLLCHVREDIVQMEVGQVLTASDGCRLQFGRLAEAQHSAAAGLSNRYDCSESMLV